MGDAFRDDTPSNARVRIPAVDLKAGWGARREVELRAGSGAESDHALVEEVVDRKDDWPCLAIHERDPTDVARPEALDSLGIGHGLELAGPGIEAGHAQLHHCLAGHAAGIVPSVTESVHDIDHPVELFRQAAQYLDVALAIDFAPQRHYVVVNIHHYWLL